MLRPSSTGERVARFATRALAVSMLVAAADEGRAQPATAGISTPEVAYTPQGWSDADRDTFYTTSQGSHMMSYAWFKALRRLDIDEPFGADQLQRYGYLRNDRPNNVNGLPIGFVIDGNAVCWRGPDSNHQFLMEAGPNARVISQSAMAICAWLVQCCDRAPVRGRWASTDPNRKSLSRAASQRYAQVIDIRHTHLGSGAATV